MHSDSILPNTPLLLCSIAAELTSFNSDNQVRAPAVQAWRPELNSPLHSHKNLGMAAPCVCNTSAMKTVGVGRYRKMAEVRWLLAQLQVLRQGDCSKGIRQSNGTGHLTCISGPLHTHTHTPLSTKGTDVGKTH